MTRKTSRSRKHSFEVRFALKGENQRKGLLVGGLEDVKAQ